jgi:hypothetical protein
MSYTIKTTLEKAIDALHEADHHRTDIAIYYAAKAQAWAAIAQVEQLKRIADRLELITDGDVYGNGHIRVQKADW